MMIRKVIRNILPLDIITALYLCISGIYLLLNAFRLDHLLPHLIFRAVLLVLIFFLITKANDSKSKLVVFFRQFYPLALLGFFYSETDYFNNLIFPNLDPVMANIEETLFGGQPSIWFSQYFPWKWFNDLMNLGYFSYFFLIFSLCFWLYFKNREHFRFSLFIIVMSFYMYYIIFVLFPVAGPQFYFQPPNNEIPDAYLFRSLVKFINHMAEKPTAAFPSSHVGIVVILWYLSFKFARPLLKWFIPLGIILFLSTVYIKAHYVVDVIAGALSAPTMYWISSNTWYTLEASLKDSTSLMSFVRITIRKSTNTLSGIRYFIRRKNE